MTVGLGQILTELNVSHAPPSRHCSSQWKAVLLIQKVGRTRCSQVLTDKLQACETTAPTAVTSSHPSCSTRKHSLHGGNPALISGAVQHHGYTIIGSCIRWTLLTGSTGISGTLQNN